jgi:hypothetical protein
MPLFSMLKKEIVILFSFPLATLISQAAINTKWNKKEPIKAMFHDVGIH